MRDSTRRGRAAMRAASSPAVAAGGGPGQPAATAGGAPRAAAGGRGPGGRSDRPSPGCRPRRARGTGSRSWPAGRPGSRPSSARSHSSRLNGPIVFLRGRVHELLVGLVGLALVGGVGEAPVRRSPRGARPGTPGGRRARSGSPVARWISAVSTSRKRWNSSSGSVLAPCWTVAGQAVLAAGHLAQALVDREVDRDRGRPCRPAGRTPPWLVPVWTLTLLIPIAPGERALELAPVAVEVGPQLGLVRVLPCRPRRSRRRR